jgi:SAM-dependent methyltransferase
MPPVASRDGIYDALSSVEGNINHQQAEEVRLREQVAAVQYHDYLAAIARYHSVPVMDYEVDLFLRHMPLNALVLDIGGCWGWHWRRLPEIRPDIGVVIVDFVRANLTHARIVLGHMVGKQIILMHADAMNLPFPDAANDGFDGIWTVQVFQHIPGFLRACSEARRVLKPGGYFINYSLHATPLNRLIYAILGKKFHIEGPIPNMFYLRRATDAQLHELRSVFGGDVSERYTECLFHPDLRLNFTGRKGSAFGRLDILLSHIPRIAWWIARQRSFATLKEASPAAWN